jgi:hypothetical protein
MQTFKKNKRIYDFQLKACVPKKIILWNLKGILNWELFQVVFCLIRLIVYKVKVDICIDFYIQSTQIIIIVRCYPAKCT